ncbi:MAG: hypothetical protein M3Q07_26570 [Pseudobdellovibrionaceae bacterium]|nr:hypothetical protein [Pseudobdellovibrionaceae bacterium]
MRFYRLGCDFMRGELNVSLLFGGIVDCDESGRVFRAEGRYKTLSGSINSGTKNTYDAASNGCVVPTLYSEKFFEVLRSIEATGYLKIPVDLLTSKGAKVEGFSALCIAGRCGPIDWSKSLPTMSPPRFPGGRKCFAFKGIFFDQNGWDGKDIFMPENTHTTIVTERVALALLEAKLKNVTVSPLDQQESNLTDDKIIEAFGKQKFAEWKLQNLI